MTKKLTTITIIILLASAICSAERIGSASYYGVGDGFHIGLDVYGCSSWYFPKGTLLEVSQRNKFYAWSSRYKKKIKCDITKSLVVIVNDVGGHNLLDLNAGVFKQFAPYSRGIIHDLRVKKIGFISGTIKVKGEIKNRYSYYNPKYHYPIKIKDNISGKEILKWHIKYPVKKNIKLRAKKNIIRITKYRS
jgi:hypothetical protein